MVDKCGDGVLLDCQMLANQGGHEGELMQAHVVSTDLSAVRYCLCREALHTTVGRSSTVLQISLLYQTSKQYCAGQGREEEARTAAAGAVHNAYSTTGWSECQGVLQP